MVAKGRVNRKIKGSKYSLYSKRKKMPCKQTQGFSTEASGLLPSLRTFLLYLQTVWVFLFFASLRLLFACVVKL